MSKLIFLFIFLGSSILYSQNSNPALNKIKFEDTSLDLNHNYFVINKLSFDFSKQETPFSIYNPKPGFNTFNIISRKYYSFKNTSHLLRKEMENKEKEPIFPETKKESLGETIFYGIIESIFD